MACDAPLLCVAFPCKGHSKQKHPHKKTLIRMTLYLSVTRFNQTCCAFTTSASFHSSLYRSSLPSHTSPLLSNAPSLFSLTRPLALCPLFHTQGLHHERNVCKIQRGALEGEPPDSQLCQDTELQEHNAKECGGGRGANRQQRANLFLNMETESKWCQKTSAARNWHAKHLLSLAVPRIIASVLFLTTLRPM